ncbi:DinB superfamily protein [Posidoniimonas polymericola]|uniref:DinB superfamily protein n=1 Tax=Posidoniimonas polymericola TaxID=2528002 RepID=A0A5C5XX02_9BACT|nr:DinB family protein [Posidoniimonas polymericola]TWT66873.1 DinB superfamily protein [Posidoniimonas polymericola]
MSRTRIDAAVARMKSTRAVLKSFLADLQPDEWFWMPHEGVTNVVWQVGHIAAAQYGLCMVRARGEQVTDQLLMPQELRERYGRASTPSATPAENVDPHEVVRVLDAIGEHAYSELALLDDDFLDTPLDDPHPMFKTGLESVEFAASHELMHIGQVVLLRRLMGHQPRR